MDLFEAGEARKCPQVFFPGGTPQPGLVFFARLTDLFSDSRACDDHLRKARCITYGSLPCPDSSPNSSLPKSSLPQGTYSDVDNLIGLRRASQRASEPSQSIAEVTMWLYARESSGRGKLVWTGNNLCLTAIGSSLQGRQIQDKTGRDRTVTASLLRSVCQCEARGPRIISIS